MSKEFEVENFVDKSDSWKLREIKIKLRELLKFIEQIDE